MWVRITTLLLVSVLLTVPALSVGSPDPMLDGQRPPERPGSAPAPWLPNPVSYSALGDSITPAYDANSSLATAGSQPYYSYAVGWNTSVLSLWKRLDRIYGEGSVTPHLLAVPGDKAIDMVWQAQRAVQNQSGFVTVLIGGNDLCHHTGSYPNQVLTPTSVANFSESLNRTFHILRSQLPSTTVIALANVVNVSQLAVLFAGNAQADTVYTQTCPALLNATGRSLLISMDIAYNRAEVDIAKTYDLNLWDMSSLVFPASDVNTLDYFHPSVAGQGMLATDFWAALPYASMLPRLATPSFPTAVAVGGYLAVSTSVMDVVPASVNLSYEPPGSSSWSTVPMSLLSGFPYNGTFSTTLPSAATALAGGLKLYMEASDSYGSHSTIPSGAPTSYLEVNVTTSSSVPDITSFVLDPPSVTLGGNVSMTVSVGGGGGPITYTYAGLPMGCLTVNAPNLSCQPTEPGTFTVQVTVTDSQAHWAAATAMLTVHPPQSSYPSIVTFTASPAAVRLGTVTTLSVTASGGVPPYTYAYRGLPVGCVTVDNASLSCEPSAPGNFLTTVVVTDSMANSATATLLVTVFQASSPPISILSFLALPDTVSLGQGVTLNVSTTGGTAPFHYAYSGLPPGCTTADTPALSCTPTGAGAFTITVVVTDVQGRAASTSTPLQVTLTTAAGPLPSGWETWVLPLLFLVAAVPIALHLRRKGKWRSRHAKPPQAIRSPAPYPHPGGIPPTQERWQGGP